MKLEHTRTCCSSSGPGGLTKNGIRPRCQSFNTILETVDRSGSPPYTTAGRQQSEQVCGTLNHSRMFDQSIDRSPVLGSVTWSPHLQEFPSSQRQLLQEVLSRSPAGDPIGLLNILRLGPLQDRSDVFLGILDLLHLDLRSGRGRTNQKILSSTSPPCGKHRDNKSGYYYNL